MDLTEDEIRHVRERMDLTDVQIEQLKTASRDFPKTAEAVNEFGKGLKKMGVSDEHLFKISRLLGGVIEVTATEATDKAWATIDKHLEKLREINGAQDDYLKEAMERLEQFGTSCCPSVDGSSDIDPLDMAAHAEEWRDRAEGDKR